MLRHAPDVSAYVPFMSENPLRRSIFYKCVHRLARSSGAKSQSLHSQCRIVASLIVITARITTDLIVIISCFVTILIITARFAIDLIIITTDLIIITDRSLPISVVITNRIIVDLVVITASKSRTSLVMSELRHACTIKQRASNRGG